jgi:hypothetical protein
MTGTVNEVTERLLSAWTVVSQGEVFRGVARVLVRQELTAMGERRSLATLVRRLEALQPRLRGLEQQAVAGWLARFRDLSESLGPALGPELELAAELRQGKTVLLQCDAFLQPTSVALFGSLLLAEACRCAEQVGGFTAIVDEGSHVTDAASLEVLFRAGRARGVSVVFASQAVGDLGPILKANVELWWLGRQGPDGAAWCGRLTGLPDATFAPRALPRLDGIVVDADGRLERCRLQRQQAVSAGTGVTRPAPAPVQPAEQNQCTAAGGFELQALPSWLDAEDEQLQHIWRHFEFPHGLAGCWISTYSLNTRGRPRCGYRSETWLVYDLLLALHDRKALPLIKQAMKARKLTVDHTCEEVRCCNPAHLRWTTPARNSHLQWARRQERVS